MNFLDEIIDKATYLPAFPRNVPQLLDLLNKEEVDADEVVNLIAFDPSLTANVMRLCNSAMMGGSPATDLQEAVLRLGFSEVYQLVVALSSAKVLMPAQKGYGLNATELWQHSVATALAAKSLAEQTGEDASLLFTAGLLHDIGKVVLAHTLESKYTALLAEITEHQHSLLEAEKNLLGVQHAELGGRVLARWHFSAVTVAAVWFHHDPALAKPHARIASHVYLANMIAHFMGHGYGHMPFAMRGREEALELAGITAHDLPRHMLNTFESLEKLNGLVYLGS